MYKFKLVIYSIIVTVVIFSSCSKTSNTGDGTTEKMINGDNTLPYKGSIEVSASLIHNNPTQISVRGFFKNSDDESFQSVDLRINNEEIPQNESNNALYAHYGYNESLFPVQWLGDNLSIKLDSWDIGSFDTDIYYPRGIEIEFNQPIDSLLRSIPITISWETDDNYEYEIAEIVIIYRGPIGQTTGNYDPISFNDEIIDDGSYTIPSNVIELFPANSEIDIYIGRANQDIINVNNEQVLITLFNNNSFSCELI